MSVPSRVLLVEGKSDEMFYGAICNAVSVGPQIKVAPPRALGGRANNKEGVFNFLPTLLSQLADGSLDRLALVVDADFAVEGGLGFTRTCERVDGIVGGFGFTRVRRAGINGLLYSHADGLHDLGLWIMPNNQDDGMLEGWVQNGIIETERQLFGEAQRATGQLAAPKFKPAHRVKADVATWLSWQQAPGRGMESAIKENLISRDSNQFLNLCGWLRHVFA